MNVRHSRLTRLLALTVVVSMPLLGLAGVASAAPVGSAKWCANHPIQAKKTAACSTKTGGGGTGGPPPVTEIQVTVDPNPVIETGVSEIHAIIQVEAQPAFANDPVFIYSQQLINSCAPGSVEFYVNEGSTLSVPQGSSATVNLDNDGNATVEVSGSECAPGPSLVEADLVNAPYYTATTTLQANPPNVTTPGLTAFPNPEVEVGDGTSTGSNVYAVFYFEDNPVYAETPIEISSAQLQNRCLGGLGTSGRLVTAVVGTPPAVRPPWTTTATPSSSSRASRVLPDRPRLSVTWSKVRTTPSRPCSPSPHRRRPSSN
jgi:hypothetical protein